jgi:DNA replication and repair protein RecF
LSLVHCLKVTSFRLFEKKTVRFAPGINVISGPNAVGKTTLLEAMYLLLTGRSFRTKELKDLIRQGDAFFQGHLYFEKSSVEQELKLTARPTEKKLVHNSTELTSLSSVLGILTGVLLAPHDMDLIKGSPDIRRRYLDVQLAQVDPLYIHHLVRYTRSLKQRNWMLRTKKINAMAAFEELLAPSAFYIITKRKQLVEALQKELNPLYGQISGQADCINLQYHSSLSQMKSPLEISDKLKEHRHKDMEVGYTQLGIHRDDLKLHLNQKEAKAFASEGEIRSLAATLRLAEWHKMRSTTQEMPLFLVDDFGLSLDEKRAAHLEEIFQHMGQVIITSAMNHKSLTNHNNIFT